MEKSMKIIAIVLITLATANAQNYFAGLNIDQNLLNQANAAITDLSNILNANFNCQRRSRPPTIGVWPGFNLPGFNFLGGGRMLVDEPFEHHFNFKRLMGFQGYSAFNPQIFCSNNLRNNIFYTVQQKIIDVSNLLLQVRSYLIQYNNIIIGDNNLVNGSQNLVIGSRNSLTGNNQWVFASDYQSKDPQNGVLILGVYLIELAEVQDVSTRPS